jgi:hypothetical protein
MNVALKYRERIDASVMLPRINWRQPRNERRVESSREPAPVVEASLEIVAGSGGNGSGGNNNGNRGSASNQRIKLKSKARR